jgi:D-galactonate transporter
LDRQSYPGAYASALAKATRRLIPFLFVLYVIAYLDRVNISFAALQMKQDLHFSDTVDGLGKGIFFIGYFLFEFPSNLVLEKVGARRWIARIMIVWGLFAAGMAWVHTKEQFYIVRFLLGVGEAGFFPGIILYLTYWYPAAERARAIALFMTATAVANVVGGPVSGLLLTMDGIAGWQGWQWLFFLEGIPATLLGFVVLAYLTDKPADARWLTPDERQALISRLEEEQAEREAAGHHPGLKTILQPKVALICAAYFCAVTGGYGVGMWLPEIVKRGLRDTSPLQVGLLFAIPYAVAAVCMVLNARHSDQTGERRLHTALPVLTGAFGLLLSAMTNQPVLGIASISLAQAGLSSYLGPFWTLPSAFLGGTAAAGGIALINSVGNLGGFVGPMMVGVIKDQTQSFSVPLFFLSGMVFTGGLLALRIRTVGSPAS